MPWWILTVKRRWIWMNWWIQWFEDEFKYQIWMNVEEHGPISLVSFGYLYLHMLHSLWVCAVLRDLSEPRRSELHSSVNTSIAAKTALQVSSLAEAAIRVWSFTLHSYGIPVDVPHSKQSENHMYMDEFTQTNCGLQFGVIFLFLLENTGLDIYENNENIPRVVRLEHLNIFGDPNPFESQNTTTHPQDQTPGTMHSNNCNARKAPTRPTSYHFGLNDLTNQWFNGAGLRETQWGLKLGKFALKKEKNLRIFKFCFDFSMKNDYLQSRSFEGRVIGAFHP